jgi:hypothetical protein
MKTSKLQKLMGYHNLPWTVVISFAASELCAPPAGAFSMLPAALVGQQISLPLLQRYAWQPACSHAIFVTWSSLSVSKPLHLPEQMTNLQMTGSHLGIVPCLLILLLVSLQLLSEIVQFDIQTGYHVLHVLSAADQVRANFCTAP